MIHYNFLGLPLIAVCLSTFYYPVHAQTMYMDVTGDTVEFTGIQETTQSPGDPAILLGMPNGLDNSLAFSPTSFISSASSGSNDTTQALLELAISSAPSQIVDTIQFDFSGDTTLTSFPPFGNPTTNTSVVISGSVQVTEDLSGPITPISIPLNGIFTPSNSFALPANFGSTAWNGTALLDIASVVPNATEIQIQLTNTLSSNAEVGASSAIIQANNVLISTTTSTVIPEPRQIFGTALALGLGVLLFRKRQKHNPHNH